MDESETPPNANKGKRGPLFLILVAVVLIIGGGYGAYWYFIGQTKVSTDNAYVAAEITQVTPAVSGIVQEVRVRDTQPIHKGDILVVLDDTDAKLAVAEAEAALAQAKRRVAGYFATNQQLFAAAAASKTEESRMQAQITAAKASLAQAKSELDRRRPLLATGDVTKQEFTTLQNAYTAAKANLDAAIAAQSGAVSQHSASLGALNANAVLTDNTTIDTNPEVALAKAASDKAKVNLERTVLVAPVDGVIAKRQVEVGQHVDPGAALLSIVPLSSVHVDANFKEVQLRRVKVGQTAELTADLYGNKVVFHGVVEGLSAGTGSAFALIPAQNASGNWIKVVQRLPVRIALDPKELADHPLEVGLSMDVTIFLDRRK